MSPDTGQVQVHVGTHPVAGTCEPASLDHHAGQPGVVRFVERLRSGEQIESGAPAHTPGGEQVPGVCGQEEVAIEGREHRTAGRRIVVRAPHADDQIAYSPRRESARKRRERVHRLSDASPSTGDVPRRRAPCEPSPCWRRTRCTALLRDEGFAVGSLVRARLRPANRAPDPRISTSPLPTVPPPFPLSRTRSVLRHRRHSVNPIEPVSNTPVPAPTPAAASKHFPLFGGVFQPDCIHTRYPERPRDAPNAPHPVEATRTARPFTPRADSGFAGSDPRNRPERLRPIHAAPGRFAARRDRRRRNSREGSRPSGQCPAKVRIESMTISTGPSSSHGSRSSRMPSCEPIRGGTMSSPMMIAMP